MKEPENINLIIEGIKAGKYSLFLGAGVSKDSSDRFGNNLKDGEAFRQELCTITGMPPNTQLSSVAELLSDDDKEKYITVPFSNTKSGSTYKHLSDFVWKNIYTLNVDDCTEQHYRASTSAKQQLVSKNYKDTYGTQDSLYNLQIVHLHGFVEKPEQGYVFAIEEYVNNIRDQNTWYEVFANEFCSNSFLVSGCSFSEPDFNYYVNKRNQYTVRDGFYPSLLIEPFPNNLTYKKCTEHNLQLVECTFGEFLDLIFSKLSPIPSVYDLLVPKTNPFAGANIPQRQLELFFNQFVQITRDGAFPYRSADLFMRGFEPSISDIASNYDISRSVTKNLYGKIQAILEKKQKAFVLINGKTYSGKTAAILRVLYQLSETGVPVFQLKSVTGFDVDNAVDCLNALKKTSVVFVDNLSDYIDLTNRFFAETKNVLVIGAEREYREIHIRKVLDCRYEVLNCDAQTDSEVKELITRYRKAGILASGDALHKEDDFVLEQRKQTIGETVCTLVNDFTPLHSKIEDMLSEYSADDRFALATVVLAYYCYRVGIHYEVFQSILPRRYGLAGYFKNERLAIRLTFHGGIGDEQDYIVPENKVLAKYTFDFLLKEDKALLQDVYKKLLEELSYYVTRQTIKSRTAEARLVARLFDIDNVMKSLFGDAIEETLESVQEKWEWNSRYWEQRALAIIGTNLDKALLHAQQAVAIERHPNTLTTLSKVQFRIMETVSDDLFVKKFEVAAKSALEAMNLETKRNYHSIQPLIVLKNGLTKYAESHDPNKINSNMRYDIKGALSFYLGDRHFMRTEENELNALIHML